MVTVTENIYNPDHAVQANVFDVFILFHFYTFSSDSQESVDSPQAITQPAFGNVKLLLSDCKFFLFFLVSF